VAARIVLVPVVTATFTSPVMRRDATFGVMRFWDVDVKGRFLPASGPRVTLQWQARTRRSGRFVSICPDVRVLASGAFHAHCRARPLPLETEYRLVYRSVNQPPFAAAQTRPAVAHLRRGATVRR
jgi:hypothetical protein